MTDNKIVESLDCCRIENCNECPHREYFNCREVLTQDVFDLINRQKAEIADERARKELCAEVIARQDKEIEMLKSSIKEANDCLSEGNFAKGITLIIRLVEYIDN